MIAVNGLHGLDCRLEAQDYLKALYTALDLHGAAPDCGDCCDRSTPVCTYTEAEYIRDHLQDPCVKAEVISRSRLWLLMEGEATKTSFDDVAPRGMRAQVTALRRQRCPYLQHDGSCLLFGLEPLECRLHVLPSSVRSFADPLLARIVAVYPQKTGFLPAQLMALLRLEEFTAWLSKRRIADAKTARGSLGAMR
mgnify:CR=1 FL=1